MSFDCFIGIDWSGARGPKLPGIQVAVCEDGRAAPRLVTNNGGPWRRSDLAAWLARACEDGAPLIGFDFSFTFPYCDRGAYFPDTDGPQDAAGLWQLIERACDGEPEYYGGPFREAAPWRDYFLSRGRRGLRYQTRHKQTELACLAQGLGRPESVFKLIGPSQVGMGSLAGIRLLAALKREVRNLAIWPFDTRRRGGPVVAEVFPRAFLAYAVQERRKVREHGPLAAALKVFGSAPYRGALPSDDAADAIILSAGLRARHGEKTLWQPAGMTEQIRRTEGWIFGVA